MRLNALAVVRRLADQHLQLLEAKVMLADEPVSGQAPSPLVIETVQRALMSDAPVNRRKGKRAIAKG